MTLSPLGASDQYEHTKRLFLNCCDGARGEPFRGSHKDPEELVAFAIGVSHHKTPLKFLLEADRVVVRVAEALKNDPEDAFR